MVERDTDRRDPSGARRWQPLAGDALLDRLRVTGCRRPAADPDLVRHLREGIEQHLVEAGAGPRPGGPVVVTKDRLAEVVDGAPRREAAAGGAPGPTTALACGALVDALFRQLVTTGRIGDPMADGLAALALDGRQGELIGWIGQLAPADRAELAGEVGRQAEGMRHRWPALDPGWLPRTRQAMRVPLVGGAVVLSARVDLVIGRPAVDEASVALVEVASGRRRPGHRADLHVDALVETLRSGAPPFVVATYYTRTGELEVETVSESLLEAAARRTAAGAAVLCRSTDQGIRPGDPVTDFGMAVAPAPEELTALAPSQLAGATPAARADTAPGAARADTATGVARADTATVRRAA
jgi:hypothetical protein